MRVALVAAMLAFAACAGGSQTMPERRPDWIGPPLAIALAANRSLLLELEAPSSGHAFELRAVTTTDDTADVQILHRTPGDAFTARVITPLPLEVPAERLGDCGCVRVWITTLEGPADTRQPPPRLAFVLQRP